MFTIRQWNYKNITEEGGNFSTFAENNNHNEGRMFALAKKQRRKNRQNET